MVFSQKEKKYIREGNKHFGKEEYENSEVSYRKALKEESNSFNALFNLGDAIYKQEKYEDAAGEFSGASQMNTDKINRAKTFHNLGNSLLKANRLEESIECYKNALRNNPADLETKYNLAYAQDLLKQQQQQQKQDQDKEQKDQNQDQDKEQQKQDQQEQKQEQQDKGKQQPKPDEISKEDAKRLLEALANDEKNIQEKIKKTKAKQKKVRTTKEW
ncbi:MAG: tetratricopeptide repeat protein [Bacteroidetes bacterium]|nr:tetratricopeptide repeat protein [Bacteroidota bacterium]